MLMPIPMHLPLCLRLDRVDLFFECVVFNHLTLQEARGELCLFTNTLGCQEIKINRFVGVLLKVAGLDVADIDKTFKAVIDTT